MLLATRVMIFTVITILSCMRRSLTKNRSSVLEGNKFSQRRASMTLVAQLIACINDR